jgi:pyruvate dehydrogenase E1 component alpha subunit
MSDPQKYRTKEEVEEYKKQDPIEGVRDDPGTSGPPKPSWRRSTLT